MTATCPECGYRVTLDASEQPAEVPIIYACPNCEVLVTLANAGAIAATNGRARAGAARASDA